MEKVAYVTGSDRGLGLALAHEFLSRGYTVFAGSFLEDRTELDALQAEFGDRLVVLDLDVTDQSSVGASAAAISGRFDHLDVLVNNAGLAIDRSGTMLDDFYFDDMHAVLEVNTFGPLRVTKSVIDLLRHGDKAVLVNISSIAGSIAHLTRVHQYAYTMSKAALNVQSKLIHNHFAEEGLTVLTLHPGVMPTLILGDPEKTKAAPVSTQESARSIADLIHREWPVDHQLFMDYQGKPIPW